MVSHTYYSPPPKKKKNYVIDPIQVKIYCYCGVELCNHYRSIFLIPSAFRAISFYGASEKVSSLVPFLLTKFFVKFLSLQVSEKFIFKSRPNTKRHLYSLFIEATVSMTCENLTSNSNKNIVVIMRPITIWIVSYSGAKITGFDTTSRRRDLG